MYERPWTLFQAELERPAEAGRNLTAIADRGLETAPSRGFQDGLIEIPAGAFFDRHSGDGAVGVDGNQGHHRAFQSAIEGAGRVFRRIARQDSGRLIYED